VAGDAAEWAERLELIHPLIPAEAGISGSDWPAERDPADIDEARDVDGQSFRAAVLRDMPIRELDLWWGQFNSLAHPKSSDSH
jgi:hypothetical protein